jgi:hypothetical protein
MIVQYTNTIDNLSKPSLYLRYFSHTCDGQGHKACIGKDAVIIGKRTQHQNSQTHKRNKKKANAIPPTMLKCHQDTHQERQLMIKALQPAGI